jgi:Putative F0F1-ATPase subunit Ca2+/Mg2+ transporter
MVGRCRERGPCLRAFGAVWYASRPSSPRTGTLQVTPRDEDGERGTLARVLQESAPYIGMGSGMAVSLLLSLGAGYWLDRKLGTSPVLLLVGAAFGMFAAGYQLYKVARKKP